MRHVSYKREGSHVEFYFPRMTPMQFERATESARGSWQARVINDLKPSAHCNSTSETRLSRSAANCASKTSLSRSRASWMARSPRCRSASIFSCAVYSFQRNTTTLSSDYRAQGRKMRMQRPGGHVALLAAPVARMPKPTSNVCPHTITQKLRP